MKKRIIVLLAVLMMTITIWADAATTALGYNAGSQTLVQHEFTTGAISKPSGHTTWNTMKDTPSVIQYVNNDDPNDLRYSYHLIKFLNQGGLSYSGLAYHQAYTGSGYTISGSEILHNTIYSTTVRALIKNRYYDEPSMDYGMRTAGNITAN